MTRFSEVFFCRLSLLCLSVAVWFEQAVSLRYVAVNSALLWSDAQTYCQTNYGTSLATITSSADNSEVRGVADALFGSETIWIGLHDGNTEGSFEWQDGTGYANDYYTNWSPNEPNDSGSNEDCTELMSNGLWNDHVCSTQYRRFVCNYGSFVGVDSSLSWSDAQSYCQTHYGTSLATITNADLNSKAFAAAYATSSVWIGLYDSTYSSYSWTWADGDSDYIYSSWNSGQPDATGEYCGEYEGGSTGWNNADCSNQQTFVCNLADTGAPTNLPTVPTSAPSYQPSSMPSENPTVLPSYMPSNEPTPVPTVMPSYIPSNMPSNEPSQVPTVMPTNYLCSLVEDDLILSWDDLISSGTMTSTPNDNSFDASISFTQGFDDVTGVFQVTVTVQSKYFVASEYTAYSTYYESTTENGYLGVTYVLDSNVFSSEGRQLSNGNTCENRVSSSYDGKNFLSDYWDYTLYPGYNDNLGNDLYLEYGNQNIWDVTMIDKCDTIEWTNTFSFSDILNDCKDSNGDLSYTLIENENDNTISINIEFYLHIVSPNPLYLSFCDNGDSDCGQYLVYTLLSNPLSIVFSKQSTFINDKNDVTIDLFTCNIIASTYVESSDANDYNETKFILTLITSVPSYMSLNIDTSVMLSPTENELESNNNGIDFISNYYISEDDSSYMNEDCLILTDYRCFQKFEIVIDISSCPGDGLTFDGSYIMSSDFDCISEDTSVCDEYLSDEPLSITLDSVNLKYNELCDNTFYQIDWNGEMTFYTDESFDSIATEYDIGDTVYVEISIENSDISNYNIYGISINQCFVCTSNISDSNDENTIETCLDTSGTIDTSSFYIMPDDTSLDFTLIDSNTSDSYEQFSFVLPALADNIFYVDCTVELEIKNGVISRRRELLQLSNNNAFENYIASAQISENAITNNDNNNDGSSSNDNNDDNDSLMTILIIIGAVIVVLLLLIVGYLVFSRCHKEGQSKQQMEIVLSTANTPGAMTPGAMTPHAALTPPPPTTQHV